MGKKEELVKLKDQIIKSIEKDKIKKRKKKLCWSSKIITIFLILLITVSVFQSVQVISILNKLNDDLVKLNSNSESTSNLESLPDMVGGC